MLKKCSKCGKVLPLTMFAGSSDMCKVCRRDYDWQYRYGISPEQYLEMLKAQDGKCKICGRELPDEQYLDIDHNKETGEVRGLLCPKCNKGLGLFNEEPANFIKAIEYLKENQCQEQ